MNKHEHLIVTTFKDGLELPDFRKKPPTGKPKASFMMWMGDQVVKGSPYVEAVWIWQREDTQGFPMHVHEFDETIGFFGTNHEDLYDLGGEIEFWLEDEKYLLTKSCMIHVPQGMQHCPIVFRKVSRPIFHFIIGNKGIYR